MENSSEKKNQRIALSISVGFHSLLFLLLFFLASWRAPNPPNGGEYGIELNFGLDDQGGGEIQPETPPAAEKAPDTEQPKPDEQKPQEEAAVEQPKEEKDAPVTTKDDSPVSVKEEKKPETVKPKEEKAKPKKEADPVKEKPKEATSTTAGTTPKQTKDRPGDNTQSHGDDPGKAGDKGNPQGKLDAKALYGKQGGGAGGDGFGLSMTGWEWADSPKIPDLPDNDDGKIEFEIECDEEGEIVNITTLQRGLSPRSEQMLKDEIRKNSLIRTSAGKVPERSKGRVVFVLKTK